MISKKSAHFTSKVSQRVRGRSPQQHSSIYVDAASLLLEIIKKVSQRVRGRSPQQHSNIMYTLFHFLFLPMISKKNRQISFKKDDKSDI